MIKRYTNKKMAELWTDDNEFRTMLQIEILAAEAMCELGQVPKEALEEIKSKADFTVERIREIEKTTNHDILAFLTAVSEKVGDSSKYIHMGLTSSDVKDTALASILQKTSDIIIERLEKFSAVLKCRAKEHKHTVMIGRTHGVHAEPMTLGLKFLLWLDENERNIERMKRARETVSVGKLSGAVGTYSNISPFVEEYICKKMNLKPARIATQVIQRDIHAEILLTIAIIGSSLDKFATEIRNLQRTDIREVEEFFSVGQKGSSAMPHKRNPITCERISGLSRVLRSNAQAALENIPLWHERDISHSSVERIILPDSTELLDYMLGKMTDIVDKLLVYPDAMLSNMNKTKGLIFSQRILLALVDKGIMREDAYLWVQRNAMKSWLEGADFKSNIEKDPDISKHLTLDEIKEYFDVAYMLRNIDMIFARFDI